MKTIDTLDSEPFKHLVMTIGNLPSSFVDSMSYYECIAWLVDYIKKNVIPAINNQAEAITEIQEWIQNLDLQDEVDHKLDEMVEDGTLAEIINQEIFGEINDAIALINSEKTLFIGDSYANGDNPNSDTLTAWPHIVAGLMGLSNSNYTLVAENGSGFLRAGTNNHTFIQLLQSQISSITNKSSYKNIIVCGGYNDNTYSVAGLNTAISTFVDYVNEQFPNAHVYIGCIGYRNEVGSSAATTRANIAGVVYPAYANNVKTANSNAKYTYLNGVENILKTLPVTYMYSNNAHPNQDGQNALGRGIYQAWKTGSCVSFNAGSFTLTNSDATSIDANVTLRHSNNQLMITVTNITVNFATGTKTLTSNGNPQAICNYSANGFIGGCLREYSITPCFASIQDYSLGRHVVPAYLMFDVDGTIKLGMWNTAITTSSGTTVNFTDVKQVQVFRCKTVIPELYA